MSFIIKQGDEPLGFDPNLLPAAEHLCRLQLDYDETKDRAQLLRMEIIGFGEELKKKFPQRSKAAKWVEAGYRGNEWSDATISMNYTAYTFRQQLLDKNVELFTDLAEACTMRQLYELAMADKARTTTVFHAAQHLAKTGEVPSKRQIIGHKQGNTNDKFKFFATIRAEKARLTNQEEAQSSLHPGENSVEPELQPLRNKCDLENNTVITAGNSQDGLEPCYAVSKDQVEILNPVSPDGCAALEKEEDQLVNVTEISTDPNSEPTEGLSSSSLDVDEFVSSMNTKQLYKLVEKFIQSNYRDIKKSPEAKADMERIVNLFPTWLHIHT